MREVTSGIPDAAIQLLLWRQVCWRPRYRHRQMGNPAAFQDFAPFIQAHGNGLTAAHRTLPFGTRVRVTDPKTGHSVTVLINDRGPFGKHRVLDVSPSAARALGMVSRGVIFVQAEVL